MKGGRNPRRVREEAANGIDPGFCNVETRQVEFSRQQGASSSLVAIQKVLFEYDPITVIQKTYKEIFISVFVFRICLGRCIWGVHCRH